MKSRTKFLITFCASLIATSVGLEKINWHGQRSSISDSSTLMINLMASDDQDLDYLRGCYMLGKADDVESCFEFLAPTGVQAFLSSLTTGRALLHRFEIEGDDRYRSSAKMILSSSLRNYTGLYERCLMYPRGKESDCPYDIKKLLEEKEDEFTAVRDLISRL